MKNDLKYYIVLIRQFMPSKIVSNISFTQFTIVLDVFRISSVESSKEKILFAFLR